MSRMSEMPASPLSGNASLAHHLHAVVLLRIVRGRDLDAAGQVVRRDREVQQIGGNHPVVDDVGALARRAVDEGAAASAGEESRMSRPTAIRLAFR